eukprot:1244408-Pleurochrysis_carterae.AAC.1
MDLHIPGFGRKLSWMVFWSRGIRIFRASCHDVHIAALSEIRCVCAGARQPKGRGQADDARRRDPQVEPAARGLRERQDRAQQQLEPLRKGARAAGTAARPLPPFILRTPASALNR